MSNTDTHVYRETLGYRITKTEKSTNWLGQPQPDTVVSDTTVWAFRDWTDRTGYVTPGYVRASRTGQLLYNPYTFSTTKVWNYFEVTRGVHQDGREYGQYTQEGFSSFPVGTRSLTPYEFSGLSIFNLTNQVKNKVSEAMKNQQINLGIVYGERAQTLKTIANAANRIRNCFQNLKRGNFAGAAQALGITTPASMGGLSATYARDQQQAIARGWLELQYGWRPLINDVYGAARALDSSLKTRTEYVSLHRSKQLTHSSSESLLIDANTTDIWSYDTKVTVKVMLKMQLRSQPAQEIASLGLTNPASVAWELVPFSFVVDWFLPIGNFLNQIDASVGWTFKEAAVTTFTEKRVTMTRHSSRNAYYGVFFTKNGHQRLESVTMSRGALTGFGDLLTLPTIKDPTSLEHSLNALALLSTLKR